MTTQEALRVADAIDLHRHNYPQYSTSAGIDAQHWAWVIRDLCRQLDEANGRLADAEYACNSMR